MGNLLMNRKILFPILVFLVFGIVFYASQADLVRAASLADGRTLTLYDALSGTLPDPSLMGFTAFPPDAVSLTYSDGAAVLDTSSVSAETYAGWVSSAATISGFPVLDSAAGVQVNFALQLENETHANQDRAGFNLILLDQDAKGIELAFWPNEIWTQNDDTTGALFSHGEGGAFDTTAGLVDYQLTFNAETYTLTANTVPILSGPLRDYSRFEGFLDPYETPNFLFLGDDTTSAQARVRLRFVSVTGIEPIAPATVTSPSTDLPLPTASVIPTSSVTPVASATPTPGSRIIELCPFGWLLGAIVMGSCFIFRKYAVG
jgi:hypothetical protein